ncbi:hypothetical protein [Sphingomonas sp. CROZ-RG-20F-R02-07]|uniref:bestrophin-like domain n=1 Tax=Sphingomonas sp. CROZ-RG-20F-R02-07 TaxID=2914832 RepID=UPI001F582AC5|nr:hypothetical protein [Sphingomonas sp. CROZ-RG-20F-R02-07]
MENLLRSTSLLAVALLLFVLLLVATQAGRLIGRRQRSKGEDKDSSSLATGMLGIFALLIAFTYSLSLARYDARRGMVLQEANAIGTTANYALMLPPQHRSPVMAMLRDYTKLRIGLGAPFDDAKFARDIATSNAVLTRLWGQATAITAEQPQSLPAYRFVSALNEQTNIAEARLTALRNHVPVTVLVVLTAIAMLSLGFAGYSATLGGFDRYVGLTIMAAAITMLIALTIDLDRPDRGSIEISVQPLTDALAALPDGNQTAP